MAKTAGITETTVVDMDGTNKVTSQITENAKIPLPRWKRAGGVWQRFWDVVVACEVLAA